MSFIDRLSRPSQKKSLFERLSQPKGKKAEPWKGVAAGAAGGLAGTVAMTVAQSLMQHFMQSNSSNGSSSSRTHGGANGFEQRADEQRSATQQGDEEPATEKAAEAVSETVFRHELSDKEKSVGGQVVHFGFGTAVGGAYGALCEYVPEVSWAEGLPFGAALMIGADEIAVPALRLSEPPWKQPVSTHAYAFVSHLVYGLTTELVRRQVRSML